jgi:hypothetical protein
MTHRTGGRWYFTASELAGRWGVPRQAVIALIESGDLAAKLAGSTRLIYTREISRFERERSRRAPARGTMVDV